MGLFIAGLTVSNNIKERPLRMDCIRSALCSPLVMDWEGFYKNNLHAWTLSVVVISIVNNNNKEMASLWDLRALLHHLSRHQPGRQGGRENRPFHINREMFHIDPSISNEPLIKQIRVFGFEKTQIITFAFSPRRRHNKNDVHSQPVNLPWVMQTHTGHPPPPYGTLL